MPERRVTRPLSCHPPATARTQAARSFSFGRSHSHDIEPMCLAWKSDRPHCVLRSNTFGVVAATLIEESISSERENAYAIWNEKLLLKRLVTSTWSAL